MRTYAALAELRAEIHESLRCKLCRKLRTLQMGNPAEITLDTHCSCPAWGGERPGPAYPLSEDGLLDQWAEAAFADANFRAALYAYIVGEDDVGGSLKLRQAQRLVRAILAAALAVRPKDL